MQFNSKTNDSTQGPAPASESQKSKNPDAGSDRKIFYPRGFLTGLSSQAEETIENYFRAFGLPKSVWSAITEWNYLETLIGHYGHAGEFKPHGTETYNQEVDDYVKCLAWSIDRVDNLATKKIQGMSDEEYQAAARWGLADPDAGNSESAAILNWKA